MHGTLRSSPEIEANVNEIVDLAQELKALSFGIMGMTAFHLFYPLPGINSKTTNLGEVKLWIETSFIPKITICYILPVAEGMD